METKYNYDQLKPIYEVRIEHAITDFRAGTHDIHIVQMGVFGSEYCACLFAERYASAGGWKQSLPTRPRDNGILAIFKNGEYELVIAKIGANIPIPIDDVLSRG
ncbi:hypothetical protein MUP95_10455 [bacterium]|nr:hypothetical protein [bacterium]